MTHISLNVSFSGPHTVLFVIWCPNSFEIVIFITFSFRYPNHNTVSENKTTTEPNAEERNYDNPKNITTYVKKKLPKLLPPFPFGLYTKDPIRPFPANSVFVLLPMVVIPFIPFGVWDGRFAVAWGLNYLVERFNGYREKLSLRHTT